MKVHFIGTTVVRTAHAKRIRNISRNSVFFFFSAIFLVTSVRMKKWILLADSGKMYNCANRFLSQIAFYILTKLQFFIPDGKSCVDDTYTERQHHSVTYYYFYKRNSLLYLLMELIILTSFSLEKTFSAVEDGWSILRCK